MRDIARTRDILYRPPTHSEPKEFHSAVLVGAFRDRAVCGKCGAVAVWSSDYNVYMDERAREFMRSDRGRAWLASDDESVKLPRGLHVYTLVGAMPEDEQADIEREVRQAEWDATHAEEKRLETLTKTARVLGYIDRQTGARRARTSDGDKRRKKRYRDRNRVRINAERRAKYAARKAGQEP